MARELLTARGLEAALRKATAEADARNTRVKIRDGDNLILIVRPGGGASWVLQYRLHGQRKGVTLGAWPAVSLKLARELAAAARETVARGVDPVEQRQQDRAEHAERRAKAGDTFRALFEDWLGKQRVSEVYRGNIEAAFTKDVLPAIGAVAPDDVTRAQIVQILRGLEARGALVMLRRVRMWLRQVYEFALDCDPQRARASPVPTGHLKSFLAPAGGHFPAITDPAEVPGLMRALRSYPQPVTRAALLLSAYVWQRPSEIREATWAEFDLDGAKWVIPAERMKLRREHWVPLAPSVVQMLRQHAGVVGVDVWVFPGMRYGKPISEATLSGALATLGYAGRHTPHGFRAMARTILDERLGVDPRVLEKQLAHEEADKVRRAYSRGEFWEQRVEVMRTWAEWLDGQV